MDGRKTKIARERVSKRFKGKKPNIILLTKEQVDVINQTLRIDNSLLITQELWQKLQNILGINKMTYARRATLSGFKIKIGYSWEEYKQGIHPKKARVQIRCERCSEIRIMLAHKLFARRHNVQVCSGCYSKFYLYDDEWRAKNSASQSISQNRPETIEKHRNNSRAMWLGDQGVKMREAQKKAVNNQTYKDNMARVMREKWASDPDYRDRVSGRGIYKHTGVYERIIIYHSKLELAFLLWCCDNGKQVTRCNFSIPYISPIDGKEHDYYPDFIVDDTIVEVKGKRWIDASPMIYQAKIEALSKWCSEKQRSYRVVLDSDLRTYAKKASTYHETQKQNNHTI